MMFGESVTTDPLERNGLTVEFLKNSLIRSGSRDSHRKQADHIAASLTNALRSGTWREYIPCMLSRGQYGDAPPQIKYWSESKAPVRFATLELWITDGLGLREPKSSPPIERLLARLDYVLPGHSKDLAKVVRETAAVAGKPMTTTERASIAGSGNRKVEQAELDFDSTTIINNSSSTEPLSWNSQSRHIAELAEKSPECFEEYKNGDTTLNAARIKAGLQVKTYAFNSTTKPQKLAEHVMSAYGDQDEKMASLLCTLITSYAHDRWHPDQLSGILAALSCPIRTVTEDDE
jgi:hypothetical protein